MLYLMSPAKTLNLKGEKGVINSPLMLVETKKLVEVCKKMSKPQLKSMSGTSDAIATENYSRWQNYEKNSEKAAALCFDGPGFRGLMAGTLTSKERNSAQKQIRILSGLYGMLKPFDGMRPYRLEMGSKIQTERGSTLYEFWGARIAELILREGKGGTNNTIVINCASQEYAKAVVPFLKTARVITCEFPGPSVYAKKARGMICRFAVKNDCKTPEDLHAFSGWGEDRYKFSAKQSSADKLVFIRTTKVAVKDPNHPGKTKLVSARNSASPPKLVGSPKERGVNPTFGMLAPPKRQTSRSKTLSRQSSTKSLKRSSSKKSKKALSRANSVSSIGSKGKAKKKTSVKKTKKKVLVKRKPSKSLSRQASGVKRSTSKSSIKKQTSSSSIKKQTSSSSIKRSTSTGSVKKASGTTGGVKRQRSKGGGGLSRQNSTSSRKKAKN